MSKCNSPPKAIIILPTRMRHPLGAYDKPTRHAEMSSVAIAGADYRGARKSCAV